MALENYYRTKIGMSLIEVIISNYDSYKSIIDYHDGLIEANDVNVNGIQVNVYDVEDEDVAKDIWYLMRHRSIPQLRHVNYTNQREIISEIQSLVDKDIAIVAPSDIIGFYDEIIYYYDSADNYTLHDLPDDFVDEPISLEQIGQLLVDKYPKSYQLDLLIL